MKGTEVLASIRDTVVHSRKMDTARDTMENRLP